MIGFILTVMGTVLSLYGGGCAFVAFSGTWKDHGDGPLFPRITRWSGALRHSVRRLFLGRGHGVVVFDSAGSAIAFAEDAVVRVTGPVIPSDATLREKVALLVQRVENVEQTAVTDRRHADQAIAALQRDLEATRVELEKADQRLDAKAKSVATDTVRLQLRGLLFVASGTILLAFGSFFG